MTIHSFFYTDFKAINPIILTSRECKYNISFLLVEVKTIMWCLDPLRRKKSNTEWPIVNKGLLPTNYPIKFSQKKHLKRVNEYCFKCFKATRKPSFLLNELCVFLHTTYTLPTPCPLTRFTIFL